MKTPTAVNSGFKNFFFFHQRKFSTTADQFFLLNTFNTMEAEKNLSSSDVQNSVTLHVPSFNTNRPRVWFHQLEAIFANRRITSQRIMFTHMVETLPSEIAEDVEDILEWTT